MQKRTALSFLEGKKYLHKGFEDPVEFNGTEDKILPIFRSVKDEIREVLRASLIIPQ